MSRRLIVLCDGTFNDPRARTNVFKLKNCLTREDQLAYYDAGVGITEEGTTKGYLGRTVDSILGGAFGSGLSGNIQQAYRWLCDTYERGDCLYFFGFSRGAFTARSIVSMVRKVGLIRGPVHYAVLKEAFDRYRDKHHPDCPETIEFRQELRTLTVEEGVCLRFVGVWDTVGSLGVPVVGPRSFIARLRWGFHDLELSQHVKTARQALAIDEKRAAFLPAPWCNDGRPIDEVEQRWFSGCHSDIGGERGKIAFHWMACEAAKAGLVFDPGSIESPPAVQDSEESLSFLWKRAMGGVLRPMFELEEGTSGLRFVNESVDETAYDIRQKGGRRPERRPTFFENGESVAGPEPTYWGLFMAYYLGQYDDACTKRKDCCRRYTEARLSFDALPLSRADAGQ